MDQFVKGRAPLKPSLKQKGNFLTNATAERVEKNKDVGQSILGDLKDNLENVKEFFGLVKELDNVKGELQQLQFSDTFPQKLFRLIEVDKKLLSEFQENGKLVFRGRDEDYIVLCSKNRTFDVKEVETSNSLIFVPDLRVGTSIEDSNENSLEIRKATSILHHYLELKEIECVSTYRLRELLHECELPWDWQTSQQTGKKYTFEDILDSIQMSEGQLRDFLNTFPVVEHEGFLRWLSSSFCDSVIDNIVELCDDDNVSDVNVDKVSFETLRPRLSSQCTDSSIHWFLRTCCNSYQDSPNHFRLSARPIVRNRASAILRHVSKLETTVFEKQLDQMLPGNITLEYSYLDGLALVEDSIQGNIISYLSIDDLPEDHRERLKVLFERKSTWNMDEISPYLSDICANSKAMSSLLVAHCRSEKDADGKKIFCSLRAV